MSCNSIGKILKLTTWGESHGTEIGAVLDGVPSNIKITESYIQKFLDMRAPGSSKFVTQRKEKDKINIVSGVFNGLSTGTPISLIIKNTDHKSKDYSDIKEKFRPAHADYTYFKKYGIRDYRGGGRSSARETAVRVAAGAIADIILSKILGNSFKIKASVVQIGPHKIDAKKFDENQIDKNPFFCGDPNAAKLWENYLDEVRKQGSSSGAVLEVIAKGVPVGVGQPLYSKLDAEIASAMMSINAVKAVEIGGGFSLSEMPGKEAGDQMVMSDDGPEFLSNNAGGILGGISSGAPITARVAIKPTSSILLPRKSIDEEGNNVELKTKGRHDPCVGIRGVPVVEAMMACVLLDLLMRHHAQTTILPET